VKKSEQSPISWYEFYKYEIEPFWRIEKNKRDHVPGWGNHCNKCGKEIFDFIRVGIEGRLCVSCVTGGKVSEKDFWEFT
jgi:hypothetical protein